MLSKWTGCLGCLLAAISAAAQRNIGMDGEPHLGPATASYTESCPARPQGATPVHQQAVLTKLIQLLQRRQARATRHARRAESQLKEGKLVEARVALRSAQHDLEEVQRGVRWLEKTLPRWNDDAKYLSLIRARIVRERAHIEALSEGASPLVRAYGRFVGRLFEAYGQDVDARILEAHAVGRRFDPQTIMGRLFPSRKRRDLGAGQDVQLNNVPKETHIRQLNEGQEYWLVITPPLAIDAVPRAVGSSGRSNVVFALRARKRRRL